MRYEAKKRGREAYDLEAFVQEATERDSVTLLVEWLNVRRSAGKAEYKRVENPQRAILKKIEELLPEGYEAYFDVEADGFTVAVAPLRS